MKNEHGLTQREEIFACAIVEGLSQADSIRRAHPASKRWKSDTVIEWGSRWAKESKIQARVKALQALAASASVLNATEVMNETRRLALSNVAGIIGMRNGKPVVLMPNELDPATAASVKSFEIDDLGRIKYSFWDKNASLERAAKLLGMFEKDNSQKVDALGALIGALQGNVVGPVESAATFGPGSAVEDD